MLTTEEFIKELEKEGGSAENLMPLGRFKLDADYRWEEANIFAILKNKPNAEATEQWSNALKAFREGDWDLATKLFDEVRRNAGLSNDAFPKLAERYLERIEGIVVRKAEGRNLDLSKPPYLEITG